jgi:hypothetical protein
MNGIWDNRIQQDISKSNSVNLRTVCELIWSRIAHLIFVPENRSIIFNQLHSFAFWPRVFSEFFEEPGFLKCSLSRFGVEIKCASLISYISTNFGLVDGAGDVVLLEEAGESETPWAGANDCYLRSRHRCLENF